MEDYYELFLYDRGFRNKVTYRFSDVRNLLRELVQKKWLRNIEIDLWFTHLLRIRLVLTNYDLAIRGYYGNSSICVGAKERRITNYQLNYEDDPYLAAMLASHITDMFFEILSDKEVKASFNSAKDKYTVLTDAVNILRMS